jgi:hypothetical protein
MLENALGTGQTFATPHRLGRNTTVILIPSWASRQDHRRRPRHDSVLRVATKQEHTWLQLGSNADRYRRLEAQFRSRTGVVPFIGSGLSVAYGFPTWSDLLRELARETAMPAVERECDRMIAEGSFEEAAELIENKLTSAIMRTRLKDRFSRPVNRTGYRGVARILARLRPRLVITTNYDRVLETEFSRVVPFVDSTWMVGREDLLGAARRDERWLVKLHGDAEDGRSMVLGLRDYCSAYGAADPEGIEMGRELPAFLAYVYTARTLVFLGCSLSNDRTVRTLRRVADQSPLDYEHFAIIERPDSDAVALEREASLMRARIHPIWYPKGEHIAISQVLARLDATRPSHARMFDWLILTVLGKAVLCAVLGSMILLLRTLIFPSGPAPLLVPGLGIKSVSMRDDDSAPHPPDTAFIRAQHEIGLFAISAYRTFDVHLPHVRKALERGVTVCVVIVDPESPELEELSRRNGRDVSHDVRQVLNIATRESLYKYTNFRLRLVPKMPVYTAVTTDAGLSSDAASDTASGSIRIQVLSQTNTARQGLILELVDASRGNDAFDYYREDLRQRWIEAGCSEDRPEDAGKSEPGG